MSGERIATDLEGLSTAYRPIEGAQEDLSDAFEGLTLIPFWGDCKLSIDFALNFLPALQVLFEGAAQLCQSLTSMVTAVRDLYTIAQNSEYAVANIANTTTSTTGIHR